MFRKPHLGIFLTAAVAGAMGNTFHTAAGQVFTLQIPKTNWGEDAWALRCSLPTRYAKTSRMSQAKRRRIARMHNPHGCRPRPASRTK